MYFNVGRFGASLICVMWLCSHDLSFLVGMHVSYMKWSALEINHHPKIHKEIMFDIQDENYIGSNN